MLLKAADDFKKYSLKSLPTLVQKLAYISSLQNKAGYYTHWGLTRVFGDQKAQKAILTVHSELALDVLRRPIRDLYQEIRSAEERRPELVTETPFKLSAPANDDVLLSAHLQLIQESLVAVNGQPATHQPAA